MNRISLKLADVDTRVQFAPALVVRYIPPEVAAIKILEFEGCISIFPTVLFPIPVFEVAHVTPPSILFLTPRPGASAASLSPVPMYTIDGLL